MANVLRVKRNAWNASGGNAAAPAADALEYGELAWENTTGTLYIGKQINSGGTINSKRVIPDASATVIGAASFSTNNFVVNSGAVQIKDGGVVTEELADDAVTADKIADDAVGSDQVANNAVALGTQTTGNYAASISGTANEIEVTGSAGEGTTFTVGLPDDVTIAGNLTVQGDTVTLNTGTLTVEDKNIVVAKNITANPATDSGVNGAGLTIGANASAPSLTWNNGGSVDFFEFNKPAKLTIAPTADCGSSLDFGEYVNP